MRKLTNDPSSTSQLAHKASVMASTSTRFAGAHKLNVVKTLAGHEPYFVDGPDGKRIEEPWGPAISYFPDEEKIISGCDKTARLWDLKAGKEMEEMRIVCEQAVYLVAVSRDSQWVIAACMQGELKACEMKTGAITTFKGHSSQITTIDISRDSKLLVSGSSDGTTRIWDLDIGNLVASTSTSPRAEDVCAVRFSQDSKNLAVMSLDSFEVWNIKARKLESKIRKNNYHTYIFGPVFWTTNDRTIVAAFSLDSRDPFPKTIYEIDSSTLEIVGAPFQGHTSHIDGLELSFDGALLVSAFNDDTVKLWAFESRHLLASFDAHDIYRVALSPGARQLTYTTYKPGRHRIYICDIPPDVLAKLWPGQESPSSNGRENGDPLNSDATARRSTTAHRILVPVPVAAQPLGRSPTVYQQDFFVLRYFRKLLSHKHGIPTMAVEPCDPLDCPATSPQIPTKSSSIPIINSMHDNSRENPEHMLPIPQSAIRASSSISRLRHLFNWKSACIGHALRPVIDVPLTQGQKRNAAAGAPKRNDGRYVLDEDFDSRPTPQNSTSQLAPSGHQGTRSGRLCFCL